MFTFVFTIHIILCIFLVIVVLLQQGKGADLGAAFSGSSSSLFGAAGASSILVKITTSAAILFMFTSVALIKLYQDVTPHAAVTDSLLKGSVMEREAQGNGSEATKNEVTKTKVDSAPAAAAASSASSQAPIAEVPAVAPNGNATSTK